MDGLPANGQRDMSVFTVNPMFMTPREWTDAMMTNLEQFGNIGRLDDEKKWQEWATQLLNLPKLAGSIVPDPYQFDDWRAWARRCIENLAEVP